MRHIFPILAGMATSMAFWAAGCKNPAEGKARAEVSEKKEVPGAPRGPLRYIELSPSTARVGFVGSKVTGSHEGGFKKLEGRVVSGGKPESTRIQIRIDMSSVYTDSSRLTKHLMSKDFFWVKKHPYATFISTEIKVGGKEKKATHTITGNLTLRGVTKSISFPAMIEISPHKVKAASQFWINRKDFGITYDGMTNDLIRNEVVIKLGIDAEIREEKWTPKKSAGKAG